MSCQLPPACLSYLSIAFYAILVFLELHTSYSAQCIFQLPLFPFVSCSSFFSSFLSLSQPSYLSNLFMFPLTPILLTSLHSCLHSRRRTSTLLLGAMTLTRAAPSWLLLGPGVSSASFPWPPCSPSSTSLVGVACGRLEINIFKCQLICNTLLAGVNDVLVVCTV